MASVVKQLPRISGSKVAKCVASRNYYSYVNEPAQQIKDKEPKWVSAEEAVKIIKSGS